MSKQFQIQVAQTAMQKLRLWLYKIGQVTQQQKKPFIFSHLTALQIANLGVHFAKGQITTLKPKEIVVLRGFGREVTRPAHQGRSQMPWLPR